MERTILYQAADGKWYDLVVYDIMDPACSAIEAVAPDLLELVKEYAKHIGIIANGCDLHERSLITIAKAEGGADSNEFFPIPAGSLDARNIKEGDKVVYANPSHGLSGHQEDCTRHLEAGRTYTITRVDMYDWHTDIFLEGFPGIKFNSVMFTEVNGG